MEDRPSRSLLFALNAVYECAISTGNHDDAHDILAAMQVVGPVTMEWDAFEAAAAIQRGDYSKAADCYRRCPNIVQQKPEVKLAFAQCLRLSRDAEWKIHASDLANAGGSDEIRERASALLSLGDQVS